MRSNEPFQRIAVRKSVYERILKDREHFEKTIGGGIWSISDTLSEWIKILETLRIKGDKKNGRTK